MKNPNNGFTKLLPIIIIIVLVVAGIYFVAKREKIRNLPIDKDKNNKTWITVAPNKRYFMFEDGRSFFPIGTSMGGEQAQTDYWGRVQYKDDKFPFYEIDVTLDPNGLEKRFVEMKKNGENVLRIDTDGWTFSRKEGFVQYLIDSGRARFLENPVGVFDEEYAKRIDNLMALAEKHGIYIDFVIGPDTVQWAHFTDKHPYYKKNGGFMETESDIFTSRQGREIYKNRIKYIVDRWGMSPNIFVWELFNEMNWWGGENSLKKEKADWTNEMGKFLRDYEKSKYGKNHLVITSTSSYDGPDDYFFNSPQIDAAVTHYYFGENRLPDPFANVKRIKETTAGILNDRLDYNKPFWENERLTGRCHVSRDIELAISLAEIASGAAGSGLMWMHAERYLPESKTLYDLSGEYRTDYFQKNDATMRSDIAIPVNRLVSKIISNSGIDWANFNSRNINDQISLNDSGIEIMATGDGSTVFGFLIKDQKQDYLIDFIRNAADYPGGCSGSLGGVFDGTKSFVKFYGENGTKVSLKPLADDVVNNAVESFGLTQQKAKEIVEDVFANPGLIKQNEAKLSRDFIYKVGLDLGDFLKEVEEKHQILRKNYKGYLKSSAEVSIKNLSNSKHKIEWINPEDGNIISSQDFQGSSIKLKTPEFGKFLVFIIKS